MVKLDAGSDGFGTVGNGLMSITHLEFSGTQMKNWETLKKDKMEVENKLMAEYLKDLPGQQTLTGNTNSNIYTDRSENDMPNTIFAEKLKSNQSIMNKNSAALKFERRNKSQMKAFTNRIKMRDSVLSTKRD